MLILMVVVMLAGMFPTPPQAWSADNTKDAKEQADIAALQEEIAMLREVVTDLAAEMSRTRSAVASFRLPDSLTLAGQPVPLDRWDVAERLEREFFLALGAPAQAVLWLKRSARYFPYIEERRRAAGLPSDLSTSPSRKVLCNRARTPGPTPPESGSSSLPLRGDTACA